jgi:membrane-associated HD superfamily phosphohydrolase
MYATLFYLFCKNDIFTNQEKYYVLFQILIITVLVPVLFFLLLRSTGKVNSIMLPETSQRLIPLLLQCFLYILLVKRSIVITRYPELHFFFLGALFSTILALVLSLFKIKASLHMLAISGFTIFVIGMNIHLQMQNPYWAAFLILMTGIVASSRLEMQAHTPKELFIGLLIGIIPQVLFLFLWL